MEGLRLREVQAGRKGRKERQGGRKEGTENRKKGRKKIRFSGNNLGPERIEMKLLRLPYISLSDVETALQQL